MRSIWNRASRMASLVAAIALLAACTPTVNPGAPAASSQASAPAAIKTLNVLNSSGGAPMQLVPYGRPGGGGGTTTATYERFFIFDANLSMYDAERNVIPWAAVA